MVCPSVHPRLYQRLFPSQRCPSVRPAVQGGVSVRPSVFVPAQSAFFRSGLGTVVRLAEAPGPFKGPDSAGIVLDRNACRRRMVDAPPALPADRRRYRRGGRLSQCPSALHAREDHVFATHNRGRPSTLCVLPVIPLCPRASPICPDTFIPTHVMPDTPDTLHTRYIPYPIHFISDTFHTARH